MHSPSSSFRSESQSEMENDEVSIRLQNAKKEREKQIQDDKNKRGRTLVTKRAQTKQRLTEFKVSILTFYCLS